MTPEHWITIGTCAVLIGTGLVTFGSVKSMRILSNSTDTIKIATDRLQAQTTEIEGINKEIAEKAATISEVASESLNRLTSADSFCYLDAAVQAPTNDSILLMLRHGGKYPLYDVTVEIDDQAAAEKFWVTFKQSGRSQLSSADMRAATGQISAQNFGTIIPNSAKPLISVPYANERRTFNIQISARNGFYRETITIVKRKDGDGWAVDEHLYKRDGGTDTQIWERVSPGFPKDH